MTIHIRWNNSRLNINGNNETDGMENDGTENVPHKIVSLKSKSTRIFHKFLSQHEKQIVYF